MPAPFDLDARIRELERELAELHHRQRDERDVFWLHAIATAIGAVCFSSADLVRHAAVDPELAAVLDGMSPRQVAQRLAAVRGRALGNVRLDRVTQNNGGAMWEIHLAP